MIDYADLYCAVTVVVLMMERARELMLLSAVLLYSLILINPCYKRINFSIGKYIENNEGWKGQNSHTGRVPSTAAVFSSE